MIQEIIENKDCVGCGACAEICPKQCIQLIANKEGFKYPVINVEKCISCKQCRKVCPALNSEKIKFPQGKVYAAVNKDYSVLMKSSSGGIFSSIAKFVLDHGGIVFGPVQWKRRIRADRKDSHPCSAGKIQQRTERHDKAMPQLQSFRKALS